MNAMRVALLGTLMMTLGASATLGQQLSQMDAKAKRQILGVLKDHLGKLEAPQVKIDPDATGSRPMSRPRANTFLNFDGG